MEGESKQSVVETELQSSTPGSSPLGIVLRGSPTHSGFAPGYILYGCFSSPRKPTRIFSLFHSFLCLPEGLKPLESFRALGFLLNLFHFQPESSHDLRKALCFPAHSKSSHQGSDANKHLADLAPRPSPSRVSFPGYAARLPHWSGTHWLGFLLRDPSLALHALG